jgi:hypothetical protein
LRTSRKDLKFIRSCIRIIFVLTLRFKIFLGYCRMAEPTFGSFTNGPAPASPKFQNRFGTCFFFLQISCFFFVDLGAPQRDEGGVPPKVALADARTGRGSNRREPRHQISRYKVKAVAMGEHRFNTGLVPKEPRVPWAARGTLAATSPELAWKPWSAASMAVEGCSTVPARPNAHTCLWLQ